MAQSQIGAYNEYSNNTLEAMKSWIKEFLGEHWTVKFMSDNCIEFSVWDAEAGKFAFGQEISVRAEQKNYLHDSKEVFETNIGSTGSFGLTEQEVGDTIRITKFDDPYDHSYVGRDGVVEFIDSMDQIHGSWGGLALIPGEDDFIVIKRAAS